MSAIEVEIFWPAGLTTDDVSAAVDELTSAGIDTTCRLQPVRRGGESTALILVTTATLQPFLTAVFEHIGGDVYRALHEFLAGMFGRKRCENGLGGSLSAVVFESSATRAQYVFTADLPNEAYRKALALDPGEQPARWVGGSRQREWLRFEDEFANTEERDHHD
jgi:hypothetical protein